MKSITKTNAKSASRDSNSTNSQGCNVFPKSTTHSNALKTAQFPLIKTGALLSKSMWKECVFLAQLRTVCSVQSEMRMNAMFAKVGTFWTNSLTQCVFCLTVQLLFALQLLANALRHSKLTTMALARCVQFPTVVCAQPQTKTNATFAQSDTLSTNFHIRFVFLPLITTPLKFALLPLDSVRVRHSVSFPTLRVCSVPQIIVCCVQ